MNRDGCPRVVVLDTGPGRTNHQSRTSPSGGLRLRPDDLLVVDRQVDERGGDAERDGEEPHELVRARAVEEPGGDPDPEEAADLVKQEGDAGQRGEVPARRRCARSVRR